MIKEKHKKLAKKYGVNLEKLKREQKKLSKNLELKGDVNGERVGGVHSVFQDNKIISTAVVMEGKEIIDEKYFVDNVRFPYIPGFRAYRELPTLVKAFNKLEKKPDFIFLNANGILHPRKLGLASHFSLSINFPTIGVADSLFIGEEDGDEIKVDNEVRAKKVKTKEGAKPLIVSPGNNISLDNSIKKVKKSTYNPHKFPEALDRARKYSKDVRKEMFR